MFHGAINTWVVLSIFKGATRYWTTNLHRLRTLIAWSFVLFTCLYKFFDLDVATKPKTIIQFLLVIIVMSHRSSFARIFVAMIPALSEAHLWRLICDIRRALLPSYSLGCAAWAETWEEGAMVDLRKSSSRSGMLDRGIGVCL